MYQALYRKWRPRTFDEVVGQEHVTETLKNQVASDKLSHAYLFVGSRGTGKTTCARILARAVNCSNPSGGNPCGECPACRAILSGSAPELVEIDAASNNGVDDVRALRDEAIYSPASLKKRVYIIDEVHMLSKPAFNALLKILEEPPEHLLFILATTEINKVPATILSRCQRYSFRRISNESIAAYLEKVAAAENLKLTSKAASLISGLSEGGMRDALSLLDQCSSADTIDEDYVMSVLGLSGGLAIRNLFSYICAGDISGAVSLFSELWSDGKDPASVLRELSSFLRDLLICMTCGDSYEKLISGRYDSSVLEELSASCSIADVCGKMEVIQKHLSSMKDSSSMRQTAELCLVTLCLGTSVIADNVSYVPQVIEKKLPKPVADAAEKEPVPSEKAPAIDSVQESSDPKPVTEPRIADSISDSEVLDGEGERNPDSPDWNEIINVIEPALPHIMKSSIRDEDRIHGELSGNVLKIVVSDSFVFTRANSPAVTQSIEKALEERYHRSFRVLVSENDSRSEAPRDINELRQFDIVKFE